MKNRTRRWLRSVLSGALFLISLATSRTADKGNLTVEVTGGVVRLSGKVDRQTDRLQALTIARATDGVRSVVDEIKVAE